MYTVQQGLSCERREWYLDRLVRLGICVFALAALPLFAEDVSFTITGTFNCQNVVGAVAGCGTSVIEFGSLPTGEGVQITYEAGEGSLNVTPFSYAPYGRFVTSCLDSLTDCGNYNVPTGLSLSLFATITPQFAGLNSASGFSSPGGDLPLGIVYGGGSIGGTNSGVMFTWPGTQDPGGGFLFLNGTYFFFQPSGDAMSYGLTPPSSGEGSTTVAGVISTFRPDGSPIPPPIPEPGTWVLALSGLCAAGLLKLCGRG